MSHNATPHTFTQPKRLPWSVCTGCGLIRLRNALTDWCVRQGCNHADHPGYAAAVATMTRDTSK